MPKSERFGKRQIFILLLLIHFLEASVFINTWAFEEATKSGWEALKRTGSAMEGVVEGCSRCEKDQCDGTVGFGGSPDEKGTSTLDAMIMDGNTMNVGSVASLPDIKEAIKVARSVLEHTEHTLLVGPAASDFATSMGFQRTNLTTPHSIHLWQGWMGGQCQPNFWKNVSPNPEKHCGPYKPYNNNHNNNKNNNNNNKNPYNINNHDTIGVVAIDDQGQIVAGTSTNGASFKIPGRVGDSPIIGAGAYADSEVGGATATGDGDVMMRFLPSFLVVEMMRFGVSATIACQEAIRRIKRFHPNFFGAVLGINKKGEFGAACTGMETFPFMVMTSSYEGVRKYHVDCLRDHN